MTLRFPARLSTATVSALLLVGLVACGGGGDGTGGGEEAAEPHRVESDGVSLELPRGVPAGDTFSVAWSGPDGDDDYLSVAEPAAAAGENVSWRYTRDGSPLVLRAPDRPAELELRYVTGDDSVLVRASLQVEPVEATLEAPDSVLAGAPLQVEWTGPDNPDDYLAVARPTDPGDEHVSWRYTREGNPLPLRAPDRPGELEVRYVMAQSDRVIARSPLAVTPVRVELSVQDTLMVDTPVEVDWSGPDHPDDYISFAEPGTEGGEHVSWSYTRDGNPLSLRTPERPGVYELRYVFDRSDRVVASETVTVLPLQARLEAPDTVAAGSEISVNWLGPNGPDDFVALADPGAASDAYESRALTRAGDPATIFAPGSSGRYQLRYVWAEQDSVLTRRTVVVTGR